MPLGVRPFGVRPLPIQENYTKSFKGNKLIITHGLLNINIVKNIKINNKNKSWYIIISEQDSMNFFFLL